MADLIAMLSPEGRLSLPSQSSIISTEQVIEAWVQSRPQPLPDIFDFFTRSRQLDGAIWDANWHVWQIIIRDSLWQDQFKTLAQCKKWGGYHNVFIQMLIRHGITSEARQQKCSTIYKHWHRLPNDLFPSQLQPEKLTDRLLRLLSKLSRSGRTYDACLTLLQAKVQERVQKHPVSKVDSRAAADPRSTPITGADVSAVLQSLEPVNADGKIDENDGGDVDMLARLSGHHGSAQSIDSSMGSDIEGDGSMGSEVETDADDERDKSSSGNGPQLPLTELTETCLGQRSNRPDTPSLKRKTRIGSSTQLSNEDDTDRRLSDGTRRDSHDSISKVTFRKKKLRKTLPALSATSELSPEMPRSQAIALKDDPSFNLGDGLSLQGFSPSPSSSKAEDLEALPLSPITETSPQARASFQDDSTDADSFMEDISRSDALPSGAIVARGRISHATTARPRHKPGMRTESTQRAIAMHNEPLTATRSTQGYEQYLHDLLNGGMVSDWVVSSILGLENVPRHIYIADSLDVSKFDPNSGWCKVHQGCETLQPTQISRRQQSRIEQARFFLIPFHQAATNHWTLFTAVRNEIWIIRHYDSLQQAGVPESQSSAFDIITKYLTWLLQDGSLVGQGVRKERMNCARQQGLDCGIHVLVNAIALISGKEVPDTVDGAFYRTLFSERLKSTQQHPDHTITATPREKVSRQDVQRPVPARLDDDSHSVSNLKLNASSLAVKVNLDTALDSVKSRSEDQYIPDSKSPPIDLRTVQHPPLTATIKGTDTLDLTSTCANRFLLSDAESLKSFVQERSKAYEDRKTHLGSVHAQLHFQSCIFKLRCANLGRLDVIEKRALQDASHVAMTIKGHSALLVPEPGSLTSSADTVKALRDFRSCVQQAIQELEKQHGLAMVKTASCRVQVERARHRMEDSINSILALKEKRKRLEQSIIAWHKETVEIIQARQEEYSRTATRCIVDIVSAGRCE